MHLLIYYLLIQAQVFTEDIYNFIIKWYRLYLSD